MRGVVEGLAGGVVLTGGVVLAGAELAGGSALAVVAGSAGVDETAGVVGAPLEPDGTDGFEVLEQAASTSPATIDATISV